MARAELGLARDALTACALAIGYVATALVPQRLDRWLLGRVGAALLSFKRRNVGGVAERIDGVVGPTSPEESLARASERYLVRLESSWGRARGLHRRGWRPDLTLDGVEHLEAALAHGKGAVLWRMQFCSSQLPLRALWEAGHAPVHLGAPRHGTKSGGWFALRILEPMIRRSEDWYVAERLMVRHRRSVEYAKTLMDRLRANGVVSIFGDLWGLNPVSVPFFDREAAFATGAPSIAWRTGAALLTCFVVREGALRYRVVIDRPVEIDRDLGRKEFARRAVKVFAERLEGAVRAHPGCWEGWGPYLGGFRPYDIAATERQSR